MQQYTAVPQTPLLTSKVLKEETEQWPEVQQEMSQALKEMRVDQEAKIIVKNPGKSSSKLAMKRLNKGGKATAEKPANVPSTINEQMSTEWVNEKYHCDFTFFGNKKKCFLLFYLCKKIQNPTDCLIKMLLNLYTLFNN